MFKLNTLTSYGILSEQMHFKVTGIRPMVPVQTGGPSKDYDGKTLNLWTTKPCF